MNSRLIESLESRTLFAGVTFMATGRLGTDAGWIQTMTDAITAQLGGPSEVPTYVLHVNLDTTTGNLVPTITHVSGTATPQNSNSGEILVQVDYYNISANASYNGNAIGGTIANFILNNKVDGVYLPSLPIHEVGVSRGASILDGLSLGLAQAGVWVDQETYADPDPLSAQGDPPTTLYDNVEFSDNYWRNDGSASQINDGNPVTGAYNLNVSWLDANSSGYVTPHLAPVGYYIGTIDQTATQSGEGPIYPTWYGTTALMPARNATGWIYSNIIGAARPLSGVWTASGGTGTRTVTTPTGIQWGNVSDLAVTSGYTINSGDALNVSYLAEDRGATDTVTFYLDSDRNPLNNNFVANLGNAVVPLGAAPAQQTASLSTNGVAPGTYYLVAQITDSSGNVRYDYSPVTSKIVVNARSGPTASLSASNVRTFGVTSEQFTVTYTDTANVVAATLGNSNLTVTGPNGYSRQATLVSSGLTNAMTLVATYSVPAPSGQFVYGDNGTYTVSLAGGQVADTFGATSAAESLGTFLISVPGQGGVSVSVVNLLSQTGTPVVGDAPAAGQTVFLDVNGSGTPNGNPTAVTDANGQATFSSIIVGSYRVGVVAQSGYLTSATLAQVAVVANTTVSAPTLGVYALPATLNGQVFNDANANGIWDFGETAMAGVNVYLDLNNSGQYRSGDPVAVTDANGNYTFNGVPIGTPLTVRQYVPPGERQTTAPAGPITLAAGSTTTLAPFAITTSPVVQGTVRLGGSAVPAGTSAAGFEVVLTQHPKHGHTTRLIAFTDANGNFSFSDLTVGATDTVQILHRKGYRNTAHYHMSATVKPTYGGQLISGLLFSQTPIT